MQTRTKAVRLLALAAVLAMVVCCLPLQAFAAGEDTRQVGLNFYDEVNGAAAGEGSLTVAADATCVNTSQIAPPAGYELVNAGDLPIVDGWVYVAVRPSVPAEKQVVLNFYDEVNGQQVEERTITVSADATSVSTGSITLPEGYEFTEVGDLPIRDGYVYVGVKPAAPVEKQVGLNIYDIVNGQQVEERTITVAADAICVNTGSITLPEGYEFTEVGDLPIRDGWVYVEVKPVEKKPVDPEQPDGGQSGSGSGTTAMVQTTSNEKTLPRTGGAGTVAGGALGLSGAIGAAVYAFVIRRRIG